MYSGTNMNERKENISETCSITCAIKKHNFLIPFDYLCRVPVWLSIIIIMGVLICKGKADLVIMTTISLISSFFYGLLARSIDE